MKALSSRWDADRILALVTLLAVVAGWLITYGRSSSRMEEDHAMLVGHEQILQQVSVTHAEIEGMVKQNQTMLQDHETRIRSLEVKLERRGASLKVYPPADPQPVILSRRKDRD